MDERQSLTLKISNPTTVGSGLLPEHVFTMAGGSIGTAENDTWKLSSHRTGAMAGHAEVRFIDGDFCLIDRSGCTYVNSASQPIGRGRRARLKSGDTITIGRYEIRAELVRGPQPGSSSMPEESDADHTLVNVEESRLVRGEGSELATDLMASKPEWFAAEGEVSDEYREHRDVAVGLPVRQGDQVSMSGQRPRKTRQKSDDHSRQHISGAPLLKGMESELDFADSDEMRLFLEEAGQTLKATVEGLLALHKGEDSRHQALRTRLQPIEDNPLRLGQSYEESIQTLFANQRSPVHLSAPAAVSESLESLRHHQVATSEAIREALDAILHAFSPEALLRRFHGYRRGLQQHEDEGRWAWDMYQHYYRELKSSRQQGFERLFQEVFEQAYDQHLRQLQRENLS
ncbi:type VI secretion system, FHA domain-containing protein [Marinobacter lipolyticus SM19]|uniref:Type VI secretion system, FHA domain-containing protein n=1 Tax=Marinobacter lipolyticus SM19 TaxID=1318628 RepID=R8AZP9_9GAMM|nr:type VI secretion system-associated FHA domain protein TagH [Marinobacter lipolyticus]EON91806.1 type VI secretion system, FHA domain-containing protein [Marinobacter lipolyticus SM19]